MRMLQPMQSIVLFLVAKADKGENQKKVSYHPLDTKSFFFSFQAETSSKFMLP
jgi:hypothetical protein